MRQFLIWAAAELGVELAFQGSGTDEVAVVASVSGDKAPALKPGDVVMRVDPKYFRPAEVEQLLGNPTKAKTVLGWDPCKTPFPELVKIMVRHDMKKVQKMIATKQE